MTKTIDLVYQPTGNACGPTCLFMIKNKQEQSISIEDIGEMCGTDWVVGTPPDRLEKGLNGLCLNYNSFETHSRPYEKLVDILNIGNVAILRTITKDVPHWIIVDNFEVTDNQPMFHIVDPWLGYLTYSINDLDKIWKIREYQFYEIIMP